MNGDAEWHLPQIPNGPPAESTIARQAERIGELTEERDSQQRLAIAAEAKVRELEDQLAVERTMVRFLEGDAKNKSAQLTAAQQALETAREGLEKIDAFHVPGQPASSNEWEATYVSRHLAALQAIARETLHKLKGKADV